MEPTKVHNFIGGQLVDPCSGKWLERKDPATGALKAVADSELMDLVSAVRAAHTAFPKWTKEEARGEFLKKIADVLETQQVELALSESAETGVALKYTKQNVLRAAQYFRASGNFQIAPTLHPMSVIGVITPWCNPVLSMSLRIAPALAAGNVVIAKPSSFAAKTAEIFAQAVSQAGLPPGVLNLVQGRGSEIGEALLSHPAPACIAFAGRTETGKKIENLASEMLKRTHLLLGSCNPVLVFAEGYADDDLKEVASSVARICFVNTGDVNLKGARLFVQESIYKKFLELLKDAVSALRVGDPLNENTDIGPAGPKGDLKKFFDDSCALAIKENGKPLLNSTLSSDLNKNSFAMPAAFYDLTLCSTLHQDEVVGPMAVMASFKYQHDAIKHANTSPYGQAAYVFHANPEKAVQIASKIEAGRVFTGITKQLEFDRVLSELDCQGHYSALKLSGNGSMGLSALIKAFSRETTVVAAGPR